MTGIGCVMSDGPGGGVAGLDGSVVGDGEGKSGVVDSVERLEAVVDIVGERVGAVRRRVLDADLGGFAGHRTVTRPVLVAVSARPVVVTNAPTPRIVPSAVSSVRMGR